MEFRFAKPKDREAVEFLWSYCFEPKGDPFYEYYFTHCYRPEDTLLGVEKVGRKEHVLADVHLRPYDLCVRNKKMPVAYIVGVATHPAARRSGVGGELLRASLLALRERRHALNILMPSMAGFYIPYGWDLYCHQWVRRMALQDVKALTDRSLTYQFITSAEEWPLLASVYETYTEGLSGYAIRNETHWRTLLGSLFAEAVNVALVYEGEKPAGYMFYRLGASEIFVSEMIYTSRKAQKALLGYLYNHRSQGESLRWNEGLQDKGYIFYPDGKKGNEIMPYMMSRIVDVARALQEVPYDREALGERMVTLTFNVTDPLAEWNQGEFTMTYKGEGLFLSATPDNGPSKGDASSMKDMKSVDSTHGDRSDVKSRVTSSPSEVIQVSVGALSLLLMGRLSASELVYEGKLVTTEEVVSLLDALYPKVDTFINEWY